MIVDRQSQHHIGGWEEYPKHNFDDHLAAGPWWNCWLAIIKTLEKRPCTFNTHTKKYHQHFNYGPTEWITVLRDIIMAILTIILRWESTELTTLWKSTWKLPRVLRNIETETSISGGKNYANPTVQRLKFSHRIAFMVDLVTPQWCWFIPSIKYKYD